MDEIPNVFVVEADGPNDCYVGTVRRILEDGDTVISRGLETKEIRPAVFVFNKPQQRFLACPGRLSHPFFQIMESIWILGGYGDLAFISRYLKNMEKYADDMDEFHAPYGVRMRHWGKYRDSGYFILPSEGQDDQFKNCFEYLSEDPDTRHAVMTFWNPTFDYGIKTNDRPCNITFQFLIRDGALDLTIFNRSNDVHYGLFNTNVVQFSVILEVMAMLLGLPVGKQIHMSNSIHFYTDEKINKITERILDLNADESRFNVYNHVEPNPFDIGEPSIGSMNVLGYLDRELSTFFQAEEEIWINNRSLEDLDNYVDDIVFNYVGDALVVSQAFYDLQHYGVLDAARRINTVEADDIFVVCLEYIVRQASFKNEGLPILEMVKERFGDSNSASQIMFYIFNH